MMDEKDKSQGIREPQQDVVDILQDVLNDALLGDVQGVAICTVNAAGSVGSCWRGAAHDDLLRLLASVELLKMRILKALEDDPEEDEGEEWKR